MTLEVPTVGGNVEMPAASPAGDVTTAGECPSISLPLPMVKLLITYHHIRKYGSRVRSFHVSSSGFHACHDDRLFGDIFSRNCLFIHVLGAL